MATLTTTEIIPLETDAVGTKHQPTRTNTMKVFLSSTYIDPIATSQSRAS